MEKGEEDETTMGHWHGGTPVRRRARRRGCRRSPAGGVAATSSDTGSERSSVAGGGPSGGEIRARAGPRWAPRAGAVVDRRREHVAQNDRPRAAAEAMWRDAIGWSGVEGADMFGEGGDFVRRREEYEVRVSSAREIRRRAHIYR